MSRPKKCETRDVARLLAALGNDPVKLQRAIDAMDQLIAARKAN